MKKEVNSESEVEKQKEYSKESENDVPTILQKTEPSQRNSGKLTVPSIKSAGSSRVNANEATDVVNNLGTSPLKMPNS